MARRRDDARLASRDSFRYPMDLQGEGAGRARRSAPLRATRIVSARGVAADLAMRRFVSRMGSPIEDRIEDRCVRPTLQTAASKPWRPTRARWSDKRDARFPMEALPAACSGAHAPAHAESGVAFSNDCEELRHRCGYRCARRDGGRVGRVQASRRRSGEQRGSALMRDGGCTRA
ncbi:hypothetical protein D0U02_07935 [Burkholderia pseudomallei]|nr:hypothetical protein D0U05_32625 [Burkholderia pseudomallei]RFS64773.1 hypothetical protein D0U02_07935 [Burkholderia pseudomallei]RFS65670.1 hypothetical protein D0U01_15645 [Burkholderia pseudomallei]RFS73098.1 hypothetical protein D0T98_17615 [Burkholderia pseudomallei]